MLIILNILFGRYFLKYLLSFLSIVKKIEFLDNFYDCNISGAFLYHKFYNQSFFFFEKLTPLNVNAWGKSNTLLLFSKNQFFINTFVCPTKIYLILYFFISFK